MSKNRVIVEAVLAGPHAPAVEQYGISKVRVDKLMVRWRTGGPEAADKRSIRPRSNPNAINANMTAVIIALRHEPTHNGHDAGARSTWDYLTPQGHTPPSITTIWRILTGEGLITPKPRRQRCSTYASTDALAPTYAINADSEGADRMVERWVQGVVIRLASIRLGGLNHGRACVESDPRLRR